MEADFSGYATKAGLKCTDGRVIEPDAFKHQDTMKVPLVWQHGHKDPENVLGHAILENRADGVYCYGFFNDTGKASHARSMVEHKDVTMMSIWANDLIERAKHVLHGVIREVSLVLSGANPGAVIENVTLRHSDTEIEELDDEAIITTGLSFEHTNKSTKNIETKEEKEEDDIEHAIGDMTVQEVYDSLSPEQKDVVHFLIGQALEDANSSIAQSDLNNNDDEEKKDDDQDTEKGSEEMKHNVFEDKKEDENPPYVLSHEDIGGIVADGMKRGSLKEAVEDFALQHSIVDIDVLFPDAQALNNVPEFLTRRMDWVKGWLSSTSKSPFSRIKNMWADISEDEARAKGYIKGSLKLEEFFGVAKRTTAPTTVYKKQKLDRDDVIDITDFDVVAWLKAEMRVMLDEEIAIAALIGDGRNPASADKINEQCIRPIISEHELFVTTLHVNMLDASSSIQEFIDLLVTKRSAYKGTGLPTMYTTETIIAKFLLLKDSLGRVIYRDLTEVATQLRVAEIVPVEAMERDATIVAILVNPVDYVYGATRGGEVSLFDDFDIDYNQQKYLIETRCCGCLTKLGSAIVVKAQASADALVVPNAPTYVPATGVVTIVATTNVVYKNADTGATMATGAQAAIPVDSTVNIVAVPNTGFYVSDSDESYWTFIRHA